MAIEIDALMQVLTQAVIEATKAVVQAVMVERREKTNGTEVKKQA